MLLGASGELSRSGLIERIQSQLAEHLKLVGAPESSAPDTLYPSEKDRIRARHMAQRSGVLARELPALASKRAKLLSYFAEGCEVDPARIEPELVPVGADGEAALLFRLATLLWSVPVSRGFGRRMRFLALDRHNQRLIGVFALGDPVFNLRARDSWIGWGVRDREQRLVNVMDAYVVGAVPPYSQLLGGKLIASLIGSAEVSKLFEEKYSPTTGIISGVAKQARLALVTVTSALGRSSVYNRLRLPGVVDLQRIGETQGWGHFQVPQCIFEDMRRLLELDGHPYASGHRYGSGPNWRLRVIREALIRVGMNTDLLRHGIAREVFAMPLATNWRAFLQGGDVECVLERPSLEAISAACLERWVIPRSRRCPEYADWTREHTVQLFDSLR